MGEDPFPLSLRTKEPAGTTVRLGSGKYSAVDVGSIVTVTASNISMSGIHVHAELVVIPTFAPPLRYKLLVYETSRQLANLIVGSATASFDASGADEKAGLVQIEDSSGVHDVAIQKV